MKIQTLLIAFTLAFHFTSCCRDAKNCPAANGSTFSKIPYTPGQVLKFSDTLGNQIYIKLSSEPSYSPASTIRESCSWQGQASCGQTMQLSSSSITDSTISPTPLYAHPFFNVGMGKNDISSRESFHLSLRLKSSQNNISYVISDYAGSRMYEPNIQLSTYSTPYKTYANVYTNSQKLYATERYHRKMVYESNGRLISFTAANDTTSLYHIVE